MPDKVVQVPGVGNVSFPDTMSDEDISGVIQKQRSAAPAKPLSDETAFSPTFRKAGLVEEPGTQDYFRHYLGRFVPGLLSGAGAVLGGMAGAPSGPGALAVEAGGAAAGSQLGQGLQGKFPRLFGQGPQDMTDSLVQTGEDVLGNSVIPRGVSKFVEKPIVNTLASRLFRNTQPVRQAVAADTIGQATGKLNKLVFPESSVIETAAQNAQDNLAKAGKPSSLIPHFQEGTVGKDLLKIPYSQTEGAVNPINKLADKALSDVTQVRNFKLATGEGDTIQQLALKDVISKGYSQASGKIDPDKILMALSGDKADVYNEAIRPTTRQNLKDLSAAIKDAQESSTPGSGMINYMKHRLVYTLPGIAMGAATGLHQVAEAGAAAGIIFGDQAITKLMSNPVTAKAVVMAIKTPQTAQTSSVLNHVIMNGLRGTYVMVQAPDEDKPIKAYVDDKGQLQYARPEAK